MSAAVCHDGNDVDAQFCETCGRALARLCSSCGRELKPQSTNPQSATHNPQLEEAERCYREAIERARGMSAKAFELRATTRLGRLLQSQERGAEAHELLAPLYASFTEGFDTRDLREAKALLEEVQHARPPGPSKPAGAVPDESMAR